MARTGRRRTGSSATGLFAWKGGQGSILGRSPAYRGRFSGNLQRVEFAPRVDWTERIALYEAGKLDALYFSAAPAAQRDALRLRHASEYLTGPVLAAYLLRLDVTRPPLDDVRVRRALALATDRARLPQVARRGYVFPASGGFVPRGMPGHAQGIALPFDPSGARELLARAGYPDGRGFPQIEALTTDSTEAEGQYLQAQWREALGIDVRWQLISYSEAVERRADAPPHLLIDGWSADYPDPDAFLRLGRQYFAAEWKDEGYDRLMEEARSGSDQPARMRLYAEAERILAEQVPLLPLWYIRSHLLRQPWVRRFPTSPMRQWFLKDVVLEGEGLRP
jgi:oligopeptide transport system substrate-binding protein